MARRIVHDHHHDGIDRRGFLECMAWVGTGVAWTVSGGVLSSRVLAQDPGQTKKVHPKGSRIQALDTPAFLLLRR